MFNAIHDDSAIPDRLPQLLISDWRLLSFLFLFLSLSLTFSSIFVSGCSHRELRQRVRLLYDEAVAGSGQKQLINR